jgi:hypothetical protein
VLADGTGNAARHQIAPDPTPAVTMKVGLFAFWRRSPAAVPGHLGLSCQRQQVQQGQTEFIASDTHRSMRTVSQPTHASRRLGGTAAARCQHRCQHIDDANFYSRTDMADNIVTHCRNQDVRLRQQLVKLCAAEHPSVAQCRSHGTHWHSAHWPLASEAECLVLACKRG